MDAVLNGVSSSPEWRKAVLEDDTCVPDGYADVAWPENFAQNFVVAAYHHTVKNVWKTFQVSNIPPISANATPLPIDCMKRQLSRAIELTERIFLDGAANATCDRTDWPDRKTDLNFMCMGAEARQKGKCKHVPDWDMQFYHMYGTG
ncbi:hypothetical protein QBC44DRAFT_373683 [Cladorrhinum sp. PSN332]|nr:hypothetical protein QBC44DRAFT_373683 [Cladorrhinum sp. PSN332]